MSLPLPPRRPGPSLQDVVHLLTTSGSGDHRFFRLGLGLLAVAALMLLYNSRAYRNLNNQEAMDAAQLGRNLAQGKGYTTLFIRPLSIHLLKQHSLRHPPTAPPGEAPDPARLRTGHPDLANAPVYPLLLAGLMKVLPFHYPVSDKPFWTYNERFWRYQPDFLISLFNQCLFLGLVVTIFCLARRLFDLQVAWLSAVLLVGGELYWRFTVSGLPTIVLLLEFAGLAWGLVLLEAELRAPAPRRKRAFLLAAATGAIVALGGLTRYGFAWLILPVTAFVLLFAAGARRWSLTLTLLAAFAAVMAPWIARNYSVSGTPFGTAGYAVFATTSAFPEFRLERSLEPGFAGLLTLQPFWIKLLTNLRTLLQSDLPRLGGSWVSAFFLVGLMVRFHNPATRRLRCFLLLCLPLLLAVQALGRTQLSEASPDLNSENLLVWLAPLVLVYGVSLFFVLLEQIEVTLLLQARSLIVGLFGVIACLPMLLVFLPPPTSPLAFPPYYPPHVQDVANYMRPDELIMTDVPWAVAWYGQRPALWLTIRAVANPKDRVPTEDFAAINDSLKPVHALYLTPITLDSRFLQWRTNESTWEAFVFQAVFLDEMPASFPLRKAPTGFLPYELVLTDTERWRKE